MYCQNCGSEMPEQAKFCPSCGRTQQAATVEVLPPTKETEQQSSKVIGVAAGTIGGIWLGIIFFIVGLLLTLTGCGAIIGIPLMLGGIFAPFVGGLSGINSVKGPCPYCGHELFASKSSAGINCNACKKRIIIKDGKFIGLD